ncbi:MAG: 3'-5' exonuclease [Variovorax paradoxus]|uniref:3'-5' exonuclease n=1 Tax=Variovorax paradoxus TaxID=34073 RepID=A0A2W5Q9J2_VARPD|nr:MAG: 3'-5' exonuclease [Variovorax paradoxus]
MSEAPSDPATPAARRRPSAPAVPTRDEIALLPLFEGLPLDAITVVRTPADADRARDALLTAGVCGFDTESKPTFRKDEVNTGPHVLQFATRERAWLFQLLRADCLPIAADLLASPVLVKVGFGLDTDRTLIRNRLAVEPTAVVDLDHEFRRRGHRQSVGVKSAVALVFGQRFVKSRKATTSNWAAARLTEAQLRYAANDAYAALWVYEALGMAAGTR